MGKSYLKRRLGIVPFEERWPGLADTIREGQEATRRALSGPTAVEVHQAEMAQVIANIQRQRKQIQEQAQAIIFDENEKE